METVARQGYRFLAEVKVIEPASDAGEVQTAESRGMFGEGTSDVRLPPASLALAHPGEVVSWEKLQKKLWPGDTFVDFDHGLNKAINTDT